jgi:VIT1/CCC1 family predicted Fe2+/Mn2+ transporter
VIGNLRDIQLSLERQLVEGFHILQTLSETETLTIDQSMNQGVKDKGVIGAG